MVLKRDRQPPRWLVGVGVSELAQLVERIPERIMSQVRSLHLDPEKGKTTSALE